MGDVVPMREVDIRTFLNNTIRSACRQFINMANTPTLRQEIAARVKSKLVQAMSERVLDLDESLWDVHVWTEANTPSEAIEVVHLIQTDDGVKIAKVLGTPVPREQGFATIIFYCKPDKLYWMPDAFFEALKRMEWTPLLRGDGTWEDGSRH